MTGQTDDAKIRRRGGIVALVLLGALWVLIYLAWVYVSRPLGEELAGGLALVVGLFATSILNPAQDAYVSWESRRMTAPEPNSLTARFVETVGPHFVTLSCVQDSPAPRKLHVFSGFLVEIAGEWCYVTAGHILKDIRSSQEKGATFHTWRLGDQTAAKRFPQAIPFDFHIDDWLVIANEDIGLDYAAVALRQMYRSLLEAGGAVPIGEAAWGDHVTAHDKWALVGIPSESVSYDGVSNISARWVVVPIEPAEKPELAGPKAQNQFYGRLSNDSISVLRDADGMSGAPIFALKKFEPNLWKYKVIGVQSGWYESDRIITACPFSSFGIAIRDAVEEEHSKRRG